ncbi:MAG: hypothetical protein OEO77_01900 [Acidimicrobiia bacterium]|nr:hypothetical protein [Acidimicrobiia bacterium]
MLDELRVQNLGVIESASVEPGPGLVVVSGETGAGKTLLTGAVGLLLGWAARSGLIGPEDEEARVEGRFVVDGVETTVARRLVDGRSRAYIDGAMVPSKALAEMADGLVEMVAQHDHLAIGRDETLRSIVDRRLDDEGRDALVGYERAWEGLIAARGVVEGLGGDLRSLERERDLVRYQADEISAAGFADGEDEQLGLESNRLRNAGEITERLAAAHLALDEAVDRLGDAWGELRRAAKLDAGLEPLSLEAAGVTSVVSELFGDVRKAGDDVAHDPDRLAAMEDRLGELTRLRRKYGDTLAEVLEFGRGAGIRASELDVLLERASDIEAEIERATSAATSAGMTLTEARCRAAAAVSADAREHLKELGFTDPVLELTVSPAALRKTGGDRIGLSFASDSRLEPGPVQRVASGGELSRLVLALRLAGGAGEAPVVVFDEIDAGIGGRVALVLGKKLADLARDRQVFVVTHLPQVAAFGDTHLVVERDASTASVRAVVAAERIDELARMLAGLDDSSQGREHAAELLAVANRAKEAQSLTATLGATS